VSLDEADRELERLREQYRAKFARELESLAALLGEAERAGHARDQLESVHGLAHRLTGTSGSYGLAASSAALGRIEARLERLLADPGADAAAAWSEVEAELAAARAGIER